MINLLFALLISMQSQATVKIAVIDTGFDFNSSWDQAQAQGLVKPKICSTGHKDFAAPLGSTDYLKDNNGHGTHIAGLIAKYAKSDYCLIILKFWDSRYAHNNTLANITKAIYEAIRLEVDIINISAGGVDYSEEEHTAIRLALNKGITVVAAAGNEGAIITKDKYYPAMYDTRIVAVESWYGKPIYDNGKLKSKKVSKFSNYAPVNNNVTDGGEYGENVLSLGTNNTYVKLSGTSQATAIRTGKMIKFKSLVNKYDISPTLKTNVVPFKLAP